MRLELTRRADYAVRAMLALARHGDGLISGSRLAAEVAIPPRFAAQVMGDLVAAGLVEPRTGRNGGYRLARPAGTISMLAIVEAVEGDARRRTCVLRGGPCSRDGVCDVHEIFSAAQDALLERLAAASLTAALERRPAATAAEPGGAERPADV
ncbi:MAG TPA: Rrf2 family transcriptional regulator [Candidatus Limnocylindria bacterium]|nr:Rrf2 family transcriptional regulator [Candidatus Limnocylindria bacterium]